LSQWAQIISEVYSFAKPFLKPKMTLKQPPAPGKPMVGQKNEKNDLQNHEAWKIIGKILPKTHTVRGPEAKREIRN